MDIKQQLKECEQESARNKGTIEEMARTIEHYRSLAELSPDCIFIIDRQFIVRYANGTAVRYLGKKAHQVLGRPLARLFPPATHRAQMRHLRRLFGSGMAVTSMDKVSFPGLELLLDTRWVPLRDAAGEIASALCISREVSFPAAAEVPRQSEVAGGAGDLLSKREVQILRLIAEGLTTKEIAGKLFISAKTVETHRTRMMKKLDAHNAPDLIRMSRQAGLLE